MDLFREKHTPQTECWSSQKVRKAPGYGLSVFIGVGNFSFFLFLIFEFYFIYFFIQQVLISYPFYTY